MPDLTPEQRARQQIDAQLVACGWVVQDYRQFNPSAGRGIALREAPLKSGTCDYLLLVDRKAVGVAEAKKPGTLLSGVALVRFALEQQPVLTPFADSVSERFNEWLMDKAKQSGSGVPPLNQEKEQRRDASATLNQENKQSRDGSATFTPEQLAWLNLIRNHIATSLSIEPEDLELSPFNQRGGLGKAYQLFGNELNHILDELNLTLVA